MDRVLFSSHTDMWETPQDLFDELNKEFHFTLDVCATAQNAKCERFYSPVCNGLLQPWWGGDSMVQPTLWSGSRRLGAQSIEVRRRGQHRSDVAPGENRYKMVPRLHLSKSLC